ncbi:MAG: cobyrinate a,c-diamide synthase [Rhodospirillaceae bacterium]|nr:cobyrinate a,c-diamide synthase [Rhodospirillaceae bacterium]
MARVFFSAAHKSSGKTTISVGVASALALRGKDVRPFKKGPDYIDPMWLGNAAGHPCYNLDFHTQETDEIKSLFIAKTSGSDIAIIEGNKGLHDGMDVEGIDSNAHLAKELDAPVVLVIDARGMTRGVAPLILGMQQFDTDVKIGGVILNFVGGPRHEAKLRNVIERYTDVEVIGAVHRNPDIAMTERHLGLIPSNEIAEAKSHIELIGKTIAEEVDIDKVLQIAGTAPALTGMTANTADKIKNDADIIIAIARGAAFGFYYPDDLEALENAGASLVFFNPESETSLPKCDGLIIGGGFPETRIKELSANKQLLTSIQNAINNGLPTYAECGGMMYLSKSISWNGETAPMVGVVPGNAVMTTRPQGRGYIVLAANDTLPWPGKMAGMDNIPAHEFHYSLMENMGSGHDFSYEVVRGQCLNGRDGFVLNNMLAGYAHMRNTSRSPWVEGFTSFVRAHTHKTG